MDYQPIDQFGGDREGAITSVRSRRREPAERSSNGTQVRLLWRQETRQLWVEVRASDDRVLALAVRPERALDAFHLHTPTSDRTVSYRQLSRSRVREPRPVATHKNL